MRHHNIVVDGIGLSTGDTVPVEAVIAAGDYTREQAARTGQVSNVAAPGRTGPELAVAAGKQALAGRTDVEVHLHATLLPELDFYSTSAFVARELGLSTEMTLGINAMSNSAVAGLELAATVLTGRQGSSALITAGDVFVAPRFHPWQTDAGIVYGDAGSAVLLERRTDRAGVAELVATSSASDAGLEGLHRGAEAGSCGGLTRAPVRLRRRQAWWLARHGGRDEVDRRNAAKVTTVVKQALYDAEIELDQVRWVAVPHYGADLFRRHCLRPLGLPADRTTAHVGSRYGHLGASDQLAGLKHLLDHRLLDAGDYVLLLGIGVGMTWTAALLRHQHYPR